jgi:hypothetical protein
MMDIMGPRKLPSTLGLMNGCIDTTGMDWTSEWEIALVAFLVINIFLEHYKDAAFFVLQISESEHPMIYHALVLLSARLFVSLPRLRIDLVVYCDG